MAYTDKSKLRVVYGDYTLGVHGKEFNYIFSYAGIFMKKSYCFKNESKIVSFLKQ